MYFDELVVNPSPVNAVMLQEIYMGQHTRSLFLFSRDG